MANPFAMAATRVLASQGGSGGSVNRGASYDRLNMDWLLPRMSANDQFRFDIQVLRNRGRDLVANNATAHAIPRKFATNVVGKDGIMLQPVTENSRNGLHRPANDELLDAWTEWGLQGNCTVDGRWSYAEVERISMETVVTDGECLVHLVRGFENEWGFAIDLIDADQLDHTLNVGFGTGDYAIRMGVEIDRWWRPTAYHVWVNHPSEFLERKRVRIPANEIVHLYRAHRPRQVRGVTWFLPVIMELKMLGGYREAELVAARTAAAKQGFIVSKDETGAALQAEPGNSEIPMDADPGRIEQLPIGFTFQGWDPQHPTAQFDAFDKAMVRTIAAGVGLSYMSLSGDLHGTSYGSGRIGLLEERAEFQGLQQWRIDGFSNPIFRAFCDMGVLSRKLTRVSAKTYVAKWHPRSFPWIDPKSDIQAAAQEVGLGIDSRTRLAAERGRSYEDVIDDQANEIEYAKQKNVPLMQELGKPLGGPAVDVTTPGVSDNLGEVPTEEGPSEDGKGKKSGGGGGGGSDSEGGDSSAHLPLPQRHLNGNGASHR